MQFWAFLSLSGCASKYGSFPRPQGYTTQRQTQMAVRFFVSDCHKMYHPLSIPKQSISSRSSLQRVKALRELKASLKHFFVAINFSLAHLLLSFKTPLQILFIRGLSK